MKADKACDLPTFNPPPVDTPQPPPTQPSKPKQASPQGISVKDIKQAHVAKKQVDAFHKRRRPGTSRPTSSIPQVLPQTVAADNIGVLLDFVIPQSERSQFRGLIDANHRPFLHPPSDTIAVSHENHSIKRSGMARFQEGLWLDDEAINYF